MKPDLWCQDPFWNMIDKTVVGLPKTLYVYCPVSVRVAKLYENSSTCYKALIDLLKLLYEESGLTLKKGRPVRPRGCVS